MGAAPISYLTTDQQVLGILAWASTAITLLGFAVAIWQISRVKHAAEAAREAALGLARRVRSRELLVQLGNAHSHLEAARSRMVSGGREVALLCLELSVRSVIEAREAGGPRRDMQHLVARVSYAADRLAKMSEPLQADPGFIPFCNQLRHEAELIQQYMAQLRYRYDIGED